MGKKKIQLRWQVDTKGKIQKLFEKLTGKKVAYMGKKTINIKIKKKTTKNSVYACVIGLLAFFV